MVEDDPGDFDPGGVVGVEFDFAVAVDAEKGIEVGGEFAEGREKFLLDEVARVVFAEELEKSGSAEDFLGEGIEFGVDHAGFGFAKGEKRVVQTWRVGGADGDEEEMVEDAVEERLRDGNGDVGLEIVGTEIADFLDVIPESGDGLGFERTRHEFADADEVVIEVARPEHGNFLDPAIVFPDVRDGGFELGEGFETERHALEVEVDGVLIAVDVVVKHSEPLALERREAHEAKRIGEGAMEAVFDEVPGERSDGAGETLGGFVAGPARGNGGDGAGLEEEEFVGGEAPFDVLGELVVLFDAEGEVGDLGELVGREGGGGGFVGRERDLADAGPAFAKATAGELVWPI